jgi:hypothetical protein
VRGVSGRAAKLVDGVDGTIGLAMGETGGGIATAGGGCWRGDTDAGYDEGLLVEGRRAFFMLAVNISRDAPAVSFTSRAPSLWDVTSASRVAAYRGGGVLYDKQVRDLLDRTDLGQHGGFMGACFKSQKDYA